MFSASITVISFSFQILGKFYELFQFIILYSLIIILIGFFLWKNNTFLYYINDEKEIDDKRYNEMIKNKQNNNKNVSTYYCQ